MEEIYLHGPALTNYYKDIYNNGETKKHNVWYGHFFTYPIKNKKKEVIGFKISDIKINPIFYLPVIICGTIKIVFYLIKNVGKTRKNA